MRRQLAACIYLLLLLMLSAAGCRHEQKTLQDMGAGFGVEGIVTLDGQPLASATIKLVNVDESGQPLDDHPPQEGKIENGRFVMKASYGHKRVEISAGDGVEIPARYNTQSELRTFITHEVENVCNFPLKSG